MTIEEEFMRELTEKVAESREAFIVEQLAQFVEKTDDGLVFNESVKVRLAEIEDFKQRVREAIEKVHDTCEEPYGDELCKPLLSTAKKLLFKELGL